MMAENPDLAILDEKLSDGMKAGAIFPKTAAGRKLCDEFSAFIREGRWKLFLAGAVNTLMITLLSMVFGTLLGFLVYLLCRRGNRAANMITGFFVWLIQGMPVVVLLMVLYYIIFGRISISGLWVSVLGFTLVFGAAMYGMLLAGVRAVDTGQTEAAYTLGYSDRKTFFRIMSGSIASVRAIAARCF